MRLLAMDPGVYFAGVAVFDIPTKRLLRAASIRGGGFKGSLWGVLELAEEIAAWAAPFASYGALVMEWPQVYAGKQRGGKDPNNLLPLTALDGMVLGGLKPLMPQGSDCTLYQPHEWKGSKKANPTARWVLSRLDNEERAQVGDLDAFEKELTACEAAKTEVGHYVHNTLDAVGLGLHYLGRLGRHRIIAR